MIFIPLKARLALTSFNDFVKQLPIVKSLKLESLTCMYADFAKPKIPMYSRIAFSIFSFEDLAKKYLRLSRAEGFNFNLLTFM